MKERKKKSMCINITGKKQNKLGSKFMSLMLIIIFITLMLSFSIERTYAAQTYSMVESYSLESPHPYSNNYSNVWGISRAGATRIRVHFAYIDTESGADYVSTTAAWEDCWCGYKTDFWTSWANGSGISIILSSNSSNTANGFVIDKIEYESSDHPKMALLYAGKVGNSDKPDETYPEYDYNDLANLYGSNVNQFVLLSGKYTYYGTGTDQYGQWTGRYDEYMNSIAVLAQHLIVVNSNAQIWLSTPPLDKSYSESDFTDAQVTTVTNNLLRYMDNIKSYLAPWYSKNIKGFYMNCEAVYGSSDCKIANDVYNKNVYKIMDALSKAVHGERLGYKEFLWIPYYSSYYLPGLAAVANTTNIFDAVIIQPHYYSNKSCDTFDAIKASVINGFISDKAGNYANGIAKPSNCLTKIGAEMEVDSKYWTGGSDETRVNYPASDYVARYEKYTNYFGTQCHPQWMAYYFGSRKETNFSQLVTLISQFYSAN